jgi:cell division protein ZapA
MAQVAITVGGHQYRIAARDGDEIRIERLGAELAARAARLTKALGVMSEAQTLVMVALMLADELADARNGVRKSRVSLLPPPPTERSNCRTL